MNINADLEPSVDSLDEIMGAPTRKMPRLHAIVKPPGPSPAELVASAVLQMGEVLARTLAEQRPVVVSAEPMKAPKSYEITFTWTQDKRIDTAAFLSADAGAKALVFAFNRLPDGMLSSISFTSLDEQ